MVSSYASDIRINAIKRHREREDTGRQIDRDREQETDVQQQTQE